MNIQIISPSGNIEPKYIDGAKQLFASWGFVPSEGKFAREQYGRFAGTESQRIHDLQSALDNPEIDAIFCSRGGYGMAQIIDKIDFTEFQKNPKPIIGFSDITILHAAVSALGISSIHALMAKDLTDFSADAQAVTELRKLLSGEKPTYNIQPHPLNKQGKAVGKLVGGNLAVFIGLRGTRYDLNFKNNILFIEDIDEKPYQIDRMMQNLRLSGALALISGLLVGQFSETDEDPLMHATIYEIIARAVQEYDIPVCFNFPVGHVDENLPLIVGAEACLEVSSEGVLMKYTKKNKILQKLCLQ
jgi:muramoyltetrapeptide carboxypeptidase